MKWLVAVLWLVVATIVAHSATLTGSVVAASDGSPLPIASISIPAKLQKRIISTTYYIWGPVDHAICVEIRSTVRFPQTKNPITTNRFRNASRPDAGIIMDKNARGNTCNSSVIHSHAGLLMTTVADTANIHYGNNLFYASAGCDSLTKHFTMILISRSLYSKALTLASANVQLFNP
jgi:hypothetical protein